MEQTWWRPRAQGADTFR